VPARMGASPALRLTREGFEAAPEAEPQMETSESRALRLLAAIEERTRDTEQPVFIAELAPALELSEQEANVAWQYLEQISLGLNREDSQRFVNERGCRG
jgi:hypothetical protein